MRSYAYIRVSGKGQLDGEGLARQEEVIRAYASRAGYSIESIYREEGVSGTKDETHRPAFQAMLNDILCNGVRVVIVEGLDRLAREYRIQESLLIYLAAKDITLLCARTEENVTEAIRGDPMKKALIQIQGIFSELEKSLLVKKLKHAREAKKAKGFRMEGQMGYKIRNPRIIHIIKQYRSFDGSHEWIAEHLNMGGFQTLGGRAWTAKAVSNVIYRGR